MEGLRPKSWNDLTDALFENAWKEDIERFRSNFAFRGLSRVSYELKTSLARLGGDYVPLEKHLIRNFRKYAHRDMISEPSIWNWLSLAQHHGLPTRLLDWTYSPYAALHFATSNIETYDEDGVVWCVDYVELHKLLPQKLHWLLEKEGCNAFTTQLLSQGADSLEQFDKLGQKDFVVFFEPPSLDDRIVNQFALFSVISDPAKTLDSLLENHPDLCRKIIIGHELKWEVRDKLDQINITERVMFPGLGGLCEWLKRHYSPRNGDSESGIMII